jgi:hypothetical protein
MLPLRHGYIPYRNAVLYLVTCVLTLAAQAQESTYEQVKSLAETLASLQAEKANRHLDINDFYQHLQQASTPPTVDAPRIFESQNQFLSDWYALNSRYAQVYDDFIIHKQALVIEQVNQVMLKNFNALDKEGQNKQREQFDKIQAEFQLWKNHKHMLGAYAVQESQRLKNEEGKDESSQQLQQKRKYAYDKYFVLAARYHHDASPSLLGKIAALPLRVGKAVGLLVASPLMFMGYWAARPFWSAPLYSLSMKTTRWMNRNSERFKDLKVEGGEYLKELQDTPAGTVNLILPSHRNASGDAHMMAAMKITPAMIFLNAQVVAGEIEHVLEKPLGNLLASAPEFISVGACKGIWGLNPAEKMFANLKNGSIQNVINYPQGFIANIHEVLGISPAFVPKLLGPLLAQGYKVRVFPVSYEIPSSFLWSKDLESKDPPLVRVGAPLSAAMIAAMYRLQSAEGTKFPELFAIFMRSFWIDTIRSYPELTLAELQQRIQSKLGLKEFSATPVGAKADF